MKNSRNPRLLFILVMALTASIFHNDVKAENDDKTLSPYFHVTNGEPGTDGLPLKHTGAEVNIAGVIADVKVKQVYVNEGESPLEAIYVFPGSTRSAVYGMKMTIGERVLQAKIKEKGEARETYEQAKSEGKTASLLEQHRPNVFQMNVANIMPGDSIVVELKYTELLVPENGEYEFVYPTVVGPRYSDKPAEELTASSEKWVGNPYQNEGEDPLYTYSMKTVINAGMPIQKTTCTTHEVDVQFNSPSATVLNLKDSEKNGGNRDFIIKYRLAGDNIETGVMLFEGKEENFFLAMVQPPKRVKPEHIPGREYIFIVDVSGSMNGFPLGISKDLLNDLIGSLRPTDMFNVLLFASGNTVMSEKSVPATKANIKKAIDVIDRQRGGGGTQLLPALKRAMDLPMNEGYSRSVVIATDGYVSVEKEAFDLIRNKLGESNFFSFGIGSSVNRYIIEGMASIGMGEPFVITDNKFAKAEADKFRKYIESPVLTDIKVDYEGLQAYDVEPSNVPDVLAERPIIISGKFKGKPNGKITVRGISGGKEYETTLDLATASIGDENIALKYLWARKRIQLLDDYTQFGATEEIKKEVTDLGLKYNLLTAYSSFVAVDSKVRNVGGEQVTVEQPLPLPKGVSNLAKGYHHRTYSAGGGSVGANLKSMSYSSAPALEQVVVREADRSDGLKEKTNKTYVGGVSVDVSDEMDTFDWEESARKKEARKAEKAAEQKVWMAGMIDKAPEFPGGDAQLLAFLKKHLKYPEMEKNNKIEGTVYISFVVDEKGKISDIEVVRSISKGLDEEAIRVIQLMPKWQAGQHWGKAVKAKMTLPIKFKLN